MAPDFLREAAPDLGRKWTYADLLLLPDDGLRHEIIDGEHYVSPSPNTKHQRIVVRLTAALFNYAESKGGGEVFVAPFDVVFSDYDVVEPDLLYITAAHAERITDKNVQGAPDLVIEILSPSSRGYDDVTKRKLYMTRGVREYWIVDPENETVTIYRRSRRNAELATDASLTSPLLPGFALPLRKLFAP